MANDTTRNRQDNPAEDPLAELARLMGQEDEFADLMRKAQPAPRPAVPRPAAPAPGVSAGAPRAPLPPRPAPTRPAAPPPTARPASPAPSHSSFAALAADVYSDTPRRPGDAPQPRAERHSLEDAARDLNRNLVRPERSVPEPRAFEPRTPESRAPDSRPAEPRMAPRPSAPSPRSAERSGYADGNVDAVARALSQPLDLGDEPTRGERAPPAWMSRGATARAEAPAARDFATADDTYDYGSSAVADDGYGEDQHSDSSFEVEEEHAPRGGRRRLIVVGAVVVAAVAAVAGGYTLLSRPGGIASSTSEPPVIRAEQGPNKVVPSQPAPEPASDGQKLIYDRVGGSAPTGNEKVVSSEEQPVDVSQAAQPQQPRVIQTAPSQSVTATSGQSGTEPKRVRTLTVRADGTIVEDGGPTPVPGGTPPTAAAAQPTASATIPLSSGSGGPVSTNPTPLASTPSIVPNVPAPAPRVAAAPAPAAQPAAPAPSAAAPAGAYVVQVASVRTEAEAQATIKSMQAKYSAVLSGQRSSVRRADLGDRGIYYRAQIGSFGSRDDAVKLCEALRAAGGDCMVQRN